MSAGSLFPRIDIDATEKISSESATERIISRRRTLLASASHDAEPRREDQPVSPVFDFAATMENVTSTNHHQRSASIVDSDNHLLNSLASARGSLVSLETANKDLLDALSSRSQEIERTQQVEFTYVNQ